MQHHAIPRSFLFVPGNRPERFEKARASGADAVILDLEDAVPPEEKCAARRAVADRLDPKRPVILPINGSDTPWFFDDAALAAHPGVAAVMLPKAERTEEVRALSSRGCCNVLALIETAAGFENAKTLAREAGVTRLVFESIDFQLDLGIAGEHEELLLFRSGLVLASRLAGLARPVDGLSTALDAPAALEADAPRARRLGFGGKLCIHPRQVAGVNVAFSPTPDEVLWAQRVLHAAATAGGAASAVYGKMVDRPVILRAQGILAEARRA